MANITDAPFAPRQLKSISVVMDPAGAATEFRKAVQSFRFEPSQSVSTTTGGTPDAVYTDISPATWTCVLKFLQDSVTANALTDWLIDHMGEEHRVNFFPYADANGWGAQLLIPAAPIGGDMNTWLSDGVTCGVKGKPFRIDPAGQPVAG